MWNYDIKHHNIPVSENSHFIGELLGTQTLNHHVPY